MNSEITFSATTSNFTGANVKVAYSVKAAADAESMALAGNTFTPTAAGDYTVKAVATSDLATETAEKTADFTVYASGFGITIADVSGRTVTEGTAPAPDVFRTAYTTADLNRYIELKNVTFAEDKTVSSKQTATVSYNGQSCALYNLTGASCKFKSGCAYNLIGFVANSNGSLQFHFAIAEENPLLTGFKQNVAFQTNFKTNVYIPKLSDKVVTGVSYNGTPLTLGEREIEGADYWVATVEVDAEEANEKIALVITFTYGGNTYTQTISTNIVNYANALAKYAEYADLANAMLYYAKCAAPEAGSYNLSAYAESTAGQTNADLVNALYDYAEQAKAYTYAE